MKGVQAQTSAKKWCNYYPFGMKMKGGIDLVAPLDNPDAYQYNGIEKNPELEINEAFYRALDPALGRWWQVDPKAEVTYGASPYCSMLNNPILHTDPEGDVIPAIAAIGAIWGSLAYNEVLGHNPSGGVGQFAKNLGIQVASAYATAGIGNMASKMAEKGISIFAIGAFQAGAHGVVGGLGSLAQGGSFGSGFASGAVSSGVSSLGAAGGIKGWGNIALGGLGGGLGSAVAGGSFIKGLKNGLLVATLNHALHSISSNTPHSDWPPECGDPDTILLAEMMAAHQGGGPWDYYNALINPEFVSDKIDENVSGLIDLSSLFIGGELGIQWLRKYVANSAKLHPRLLKQRDAGHRGATFMRETISTLGSIRIIDWRTISFSYRTAAGQSFSIGYNPWTRRIYHLAPGSW